MYHGCTNEIRCKPHTVRKRRGGENGGMDEWLLAVTSGSVAKGLAKDLEIAGSGLVHCHFPLPLHFLMITLCGAQG